MSENLRIREYWVDEVKIIACILVVLGHFFQSMIDANILQSTALYKWFNTTIYYFHVPLFFICSGYLYQKHSKVDSFRSWTRNVKKKALALGIPYLTFTIFTWTTKTIFSGEVNIKIGGLGETLISPTTLPYWFLYSLFFLFFLTPTFRNVNTALYGLCIALIAKIIISVVSCHVFIISTIFSNEIWFVIGMCISSFNIYLKGKILSGIMYGICFLGLSIYSFWANVNGSVLSFLMGILACAAIILIVANKEEERKWVDLISNYTMPIFLMHTLFAAPIRAVLIKVGIGTPIIQVIVGLTVSFVGPIITATVMHRTKYLEVFLYPNKVFKEKRKEKYV